MDIESIERFYVVGVRWVTAVSSVGSGQRNIFWQSDRPPVRLPNIETRIDNFTDNCYCKNPLIIFFLQFPFKDCENDMTSPKLIFLKSFFKRLKRCCFHHIMLVGELDGWPDQSWLNIRHYKASRRREVSEPIWVLCVVAGSGLMVREIKLECPHVPVHFPVYTDQQLDTRTLGEGSQHTMSVTRQRRVLRLEMMIRPAVR